MGEIADRCFRNGGYGNQGTRLVVFASTPKTSAGVGEAGSFLLQKESLSSIRKLLHKAMHPIRVLWEPGREKEGHFGFNFGSTDSELFDAAVATTGAINSLIHK
jgi:hypothetical protein